MADIEGTVTVGYNETEIENVRKSIREAYDGLVKESETLKEPVIKAIDDCWHGPDSVKFVELLNKKIEAQNGALKDVFEVLAGEENGVLTTLRDEWKKFQNEGIQFEDVQ